MVKRKTVRQKIGKKEAKKQSEKDVELATSFSEEVEPGSSRLKRKLTKKLQFLSRLQDTQSFLGTKKIISKKRRRQKKSALNSLSSLAEVLPSIKDTTLKELRLPRRNQSRARQQLVVTEVEQLSKVLGHPQFKTNPFMAIHEHLVNTLGPVKEDKLKSSREKGAEKNSKQRKKSKVNDMEE